MPHINFEFKARVKNIAELEKNLLLLHPIFGGEDNQKDTYYNLKKGRLKLREGNIENALIYYERQDMADAKQSNVVLYNHQPNEALKHLLQQVHGIKVVVEKKRKIYFIENVKFHFDEVLALGSFIEVEAMDKNETLGVHKLKAQCQYYFQYFKLNPSQYVQHSYSDLLLDAIQL